MCSSAVLSLFRDSTNGKVNEERFSLFNAPLFVEYEHFENLLKSLILHVIIGAESLATQAFGRCPMRTVARLRH